MNGVLRPLRPHHERAREGLQRSYSAGRRRPMVQLPTGAGKTRLAAEIIRGALAKGKRVAFVVPALSLIDQTVAAFEAEGIHCIGVMQGLHERIRCAAPTPPSLKTKNWIVSRRIAFAKARERVAHG